MEFKFETSYSREAITIMAKAIRKTARKKRNRRSHFFGIIVIALALLLTLPLGNKEFVLDFKTIITWLVVAILVFTLIFEDKINGYIAKKRMLPGLNKATVTFHADGYHSETEIGSSDFKYNSINLLAETQNTSYLYLVKITRKFTTKKVLRAVPSKSFGNSYSRLPERVFKIFRSIFIAFLSNRNKNQLNITQRDIAAKR